MTFHWVYILNCINSYILGRFLDRFVRSLHHCICIRHNEHFVQTNLNKRCHYKKAQDYYTGESDELCRYSCNDSRDLGPNCSIRHALLKGGKWNTNYYG